MKFSEQGCGEGVHVTMLYFLAVGHIQLAATQCTRLNVALLHS
jgi:hypothetical protein